MWGYLKSSMAIISSIDGGLAETDRHWAVPHYLSAPFDRFLFEFSQLKQKGFVKLLSWRPIRQVHRLLFRFRGTLQERQYSQVPFSLLPKHCKTWPKTTSHVLVLGQPVQFKWSIIFPCKNKESNSVVREWSISSLISLTYQSSHYGSPKSSIKASNLRSCLTENSIISCNCYIADHMENMSTSNGIPGNL